MSNVTATGMRLQFTDVPGNKIKNVSGVDPEMSVGELVQAMVREMNLPPNDAVYRARLEREGRQLHASELVKDALVDGDRLELLRDVSAG